MSLSDIQVIENTHFRDEDGKLVCFTNLPDGSKFEQVVSSREAVQKNMVGWCNTVREYMASLVAQHEAECRAKKERRQSIEIIEPTREPPPSPPAGGDAKSLVLAHWEYLKDKRRELKAQLEATEAYLEGINAEMDELGPVIKAWKGVKGE